MEPVNEKLIERIDAYIEALFTPPDATLSQNLADAEAAGLPAINVSPNQGRLLYLLAKIAGAKRVLEIGTLGGYSTPWLARALCPPMASSSRSNSSRGTPRSRVEAWIARP
jgi:predicted O-methyltransferase YrrM